MTDRSILFSAPMVRALLAGTKTQTRRVLKGGARAAHEPQWEARKGADGVWCLEANSSAVSGRIAPHIPIDEGDRLWVKERLQCATTDQGVRHPIYFADHSKV